MSQHPSLRVDSVGVKHRNVLKRFERIKKLQEQSKWQDRSSIFGLPKVKSMKIKVKKSKDVATEAAVPGAAPAAGTAAAPAAGVKAEAPKAAKGSGSAPKTGAAAKAEKPKK